MEPCICSQRAFHLKASNTMNLLILQTGKTSISGLGFQGLPPKFCQGTKRVSRGPGRGPCLLPEMQGKCQKTTSLAQRANIQGGKSRGCGTTSKREEDSLQKLAASEFHLQHHSTASKKKKGNEATGDHGQKQSWREGAARGRRCCRLTAGVRDTGF